MILEKIRVVLVLLAMGIVLPFIIPLLVIVLLPFVILSSTPTKSINWVKYAERLSKK